MSAAAEWFRSRAFAAGLFAIASASSAPDFGPLRFRIEHQYRNHPEYAQHVREETRRSQLAIPVRDLWRRRSNAPKGSDRQTVENAISKLLAASPREWQYREYGITQLSVEHWAQNQGIDISAAQRVARNLERGGAIYRFQRWERADRFNAEGWAAYERIEAALLDAGATPSYARRKAAREAGVRWDERSALTVVFPKPRAFWSKDDPGLTPDEVIAIARPLKSTPYLIPAACLAAEERKRDEAAGAPWTEDRYHQAMRRAELEHQAALEAERRSRRSGRSAPSPATPTAPASPPARPTAPAPPSASDEEYLQTFATFVEVFRDVRRDDRRRGYNDDLIGELPAQAQQLEIGRYLRKQVADVRLMPCSSGLTEDEVSRGFFGEVTRAFLEKDGALNRESGDYFHLATAHKITWIDKRGDLADSAKKARSRWEKRGNRSEETGGGSVSAPAPVAARGEPLNPAALHPSSSCASRPAVQGGCADASEASRRPDADGGPQEGPIPGGAPSEAAADEGGAVSVLAALGRPP